ncbi:MAG: hypothetical protein ABEK84_07605 [Salinibacter sp.]
MLLVDASYLLDSNLLVYCFDEKAPEKKDRTLATIDRVGRLPKAALPSQVLAEFSNVALYKLEPPLSPDEVTEQVELYREVFPVFPLTSSYGSGGDPRGSGPPLFLLRRADLSRR